MSAVTMPAVHDFLGALAIILCVAALTTLVFQKLRQPVVLGYLLTGFIIGPHVPIPLIADAEVVSVLAELGVILVMFSIGCEFSLGRLLKLAPTAGITALLEIGLVASLGFGVGRAFGWSTQACIFTAAIVAISSTTVVAKTFDERGVTGRVRDLVVGVLVVEDLIAIVLLATLTAVSSGAGLSGSSILATIARLAAFLAGLVVLGLLTVPRLVRSIAKESRPETKVITLVGVCFAMALLAREFGYSVALGAFVAGSLVAESGEARALEQLVHPVRDVLAAVFFVSVGMLIDPAVLARHWPAVLCLSGLVVTGKALGVSLGAFLTGHGTRASVQAGLSLGQIGEFSFILAGLALASDRGAAHLYPVAVAVSAVTTLTTPLLVGASGRVASWVDRALPAPLQTFVALYGSWIEALRATPRRDSLRSLLQRLVRGLFIDAFLLGALIVATSLLMDELLKLAATRLGVPPVIARPLLVLAAAVLAVPLVIGLVRQAGRLGLTLARRAIPGAHVGRPDRADLAAAPRRALVVTLQLGAVLLVGLPLVALTQPFVPGYYLAPALLTLMAGLALGFWRSATNLEGHVRAGAQVILEALTRQSRPNRAHAKGDELAAVRALLPGLGEPVPVRIPKRAAAVGQSLASLNLRGLTGATVLAIRRGDEGILVPTAEQVLHADDVVALAGSREAIAAATAALTRGPTSA